MKHLKRKYSVLGGVVAPKSSAYSIMGMRNPLLEIPTNKIDISLPSLRDNGATSRFNDFNPYNAAPKKSPEVVRNNMSMHTTKKESRYVINVNTFQPMGSPILSNTRK